MHILFHEQTVYERGKNSKKSYLMKLSTIYGKAMQVLCFNDEAKDNVYY